MKATPDYEKMSVFEQVSEGLKESLANVRGELTLRTTTLPAPPPPASPSRVVRLRKKLGMSQPVFAAYLNVSKKTVQSWEQGSRVPRSSDLRLLQVVEYAPAEFGMIVSTTLVKKSRSRMRRRKPVFR